MVIGKRWSEPFDRICHSLSFLLFFPSIDNRRNDWREGETERERREKRRNRERGKKETIDGWNDRSSMRVETTSVFSLDLYHGKMKILFRLYSFTGRRAGFNKGHLNRSTNRRFSLDSAVFRARAHVREKKMSDYWEYIRWERVSPEWNVSFVKRGQYCSQFEGLGCSLFFLFFSFLSPCFSHLEQWNLKYGNGGKLCWPSPFCHRYSLETSIKCGSLLFQPTTVA